LAQGVQRHWGQPWVLAGFWAAYEVGFKIKDELLQPDLGV
jgi:hypothetical protein